jgi:hypothetical protein
VGPAGIPGYGYPHRRPAAVRPLRRSGIEALRSAFVPPISFFFPDRTLTVSEAGADFLVARLERRVEASKTAATLAERIAIEAHRGRFAPPGQDLELSLEEQRELLDTLKATAEAWPEEERAALHELQLALAVQTSRAEQPDS